MDVRDGILRDRTWRVIARCASGRKDGGQRRRVEGMSDGLRVRVDVEPAVVGCSRWSASCVW